MAATAEDCATVSAAVPLIALAVAHSSVAEDNNMPISAGQADEEAYSDHSVPGPLTAPTAAALSVCPATY